MKNLKLYWVDAFTDSAFCGNTAAVIVNADGLSDEQKQIIAREMNLSETVFISESNVADFRVQFFTPKQETALCGHGTIAAFWVLGSIGKVVGMDEVVAVKQETHAGMLPIEIYFDKNKMPVRIMMHQTLPEFFEKDVQIDEMANVLGISIEKFESDYPLKVVSTGRPKLFIHIKNRDILYGIKPELLMLR
jgi:phenazine biosynthesis protein PhzF family